MTGRRLRGRALRRKKGGSGRSMHRPARNQGSILTRRNGHLHVEIQEDCLTAMHGKGMFSR